MAESLLKIKNKYLHVKSNKHVKLKSLIEGSFQTKKIF